MTRAVHFDGNAQLINEFIGGNVTFARPFSCGVLSYWFKSPTPDGVILLAYSKTAGHCLRMQHIKGKPLLFIQDPRSRTTKSVIYEAADSLPQDNNWHNMCFGWNVNTFPYVVQYTLDSLRKTGRVLPLNTSPVAFEVDYSITDEWTIGAEELTETVINDPFAVGNLLPYNGDLAELYLSCLPAYLDILHPVGFTVSLFGQQWTWGGKGFTTPDDKAMEIGPNGVGATGIPPHLYCRVDNANQVPDTFRVNNGLAGEVFFNKGSSLTLASSDPFPVP